MRILSRLALTVTLAIPLAGCAVDVGRIIADARKPTVTFATPQSWSCQETPVKVPLKEGLDSCTRCSNISAIVQQVSIDKQAELVTPKGAVLICSTSAFVQP